MKTAALVICILSGLIVGYGMGYVEGYEDKREHMKAWTWVEHPLGGGCYQTPDGRIVVAEGKSQF